MTWLTWQAIRALATHEVQKDFGGEVRYVEPRQPDHYRVVLGRLLNERPNKPLTPGALVYVRDAWRHPWRSALRRLPVPCTLLTVFSDPHVKAHATSALLDGTLIQHWFAVQCETTHPNLTAMPIGIDGRSIPALEQATQGTRDTLLYVNVQGRSEERQQLTRHFRTLPWARVEDWGTLSQRAYFDRLGRSRYVLSPPGRGWDCYRTYEAIAMGAIPIVLRRPPLSSVCDGLPVLMVDGWHEVTKDRLETAIVTGNVERMTEAYWTERILTCLT